MLDEIAEWLLVIEKVAVLGYATIAETDEVNSAKMAVKAFIASRMQR